MPDTARALLMALTEIERHATQMARLMGCQCGKPVDGTDGIFYPYASFNRDDSVGKPLDQIPWEMRHEPGCVMDGQSGVG
jgi:hypothetical protein